ncbi:unnamed protein product, partial [Effrenium voratum]
EARQLAPNVVSCSAACSACAKASAWRWALRLLCQAHRKQLAPNVITYSAAITACERASEWQQALQLWQEAQRSVPGDVVICTSLLSACARAAAARPGVGLFQDLRLARVRPNLVTYTAALTCFEKRACMTEMLQVVDDMTLRLHCFAAALRRKDSGGLG